MQIADLFGVGTGPMRWERPMIFLLALVCRSLVWLTAAPMVGSISATPGPDIWLDSLVGDATLVVVAVVVFRLVPRAILAVPLIAITSAGAEFGIELLQVGFADTSLPLNRAVIFVVNNALWTVCVLGGIALGLQWGRLLAGIWAGAVGGILTNRVVQTTIGFVLGGSQGPVRDRVALAVISVVSISVFALVLWGLLRAVSRDEQPVRVSKGYFLGTLTAVYVSACVLLFVPLALIVAEIWRLETPEESRSAQWLIAFALGLAAYGGVVFSVFVYRMWAVIQDGQTRTTPGRAVGLLFVPLYNVYWAFIAIAGYPREYNAYASRHGIAVRELPQWPFTAYVVACVASFVPVVGLLAGLVAVALALILVAKACDGINAFPATAVDELVPDEPIAGGDWRKPAVISALTLLLVMGSCGNPRTLTQQGYTVTVKAIERTQSANLPGAGQISARDGNEILLVRLELSRTPTSEPQLKFERFELVCTDGIPGETMMMRYGGTFSDEPTPLAIPFGVPKGAQPKTLTVGELTFDVAGFPVDTSTGS